MRNFIVIHPNNHTKALVHAPLHKVYCEEEQQDATNAVDRGCARSSSARSRIPKMREIMFCLYSGWTHIHLTRVISC